jgi:hypothetical protein
MADYFEETEREVDARIAPLVRELWARGVWAEDPCEEARPGLASITFITAGDVSEFLEAAQREYDVKLESDWYKAEGEGEEWRVWLGLVVLFPTNDVPRLAKAIKKKPPPESRPEHYRRWGPRDN